MNAKNEAVEQAPQKARPKELVYDALKPGPRFTIVPKNAGELRVGLIGWRQLDRDTPTLTLSALRRSLRQAFRDDAPDLVLCAGAGVMLPRETALGQKRSKSVQSTIGPSLAAAAGCSVLFEQGGDDAGQWLLATSRGLHLIRHWQHATDKDEVARYGIFTLAEWHVGLGAMVVQNGVRPVTLLLAICNEVRAFERGRDKDASVIGVGLRGGTAPKVFQGDWVLLHPAHHSYLRSQDRGFAISHPTADVPVSLLAGLTASGPFKDGTRPPLAALHASNYYGLGAGLAKDRKCGLKRYRAGKPRALTRAHRVVGGRGVTWAIATVKLPRRP